MLSLRVLQCLLSPPYDCWKLILLPIFVLSFSLTPRHCLCSLMYVSCKSYFLFLDFMLHSHSHFHKILRRLLLTFQIIGQRNKEDWGLSTWLYLNIDLNNPTFHHCTMIIKKSQTSQEVAKLLKKEFKLQPKISVHSYLSTIKHSSTGKWHKPIFHRMQYIIKSI